jgi:hypothetical protein
VGIIISYAVPLGLGAGLRATQLIWSVQSGVEFPLRALGNGQAQQRAGNRLADLNHRLFSSFRAREDDFVSRALVSARNGVLRPLVLGQTH